MRTVRYFFDTEFIERGPNYPIELISVGLVCEDGREYYAISTEFNRKHASQWVKDNVLVHLPDRNVNPIYGGARAFEEARMWKSLRQIADDLRKFVRVYGEEPEFWSYYADYDWVVFAQIFGTMMDLPQGFPMFCMDIKQRQKMLKAPAFPQQLTGEHHALADARWHKHLYELLDVFEEKQAMARLRFIMTGEATEGLDTFDELAR